MFGEELWPDLWNNYECSDILKAYFFICAKYRAASYLVFTVNALSGSNSIFFLFPEFALLLRMNIMINNEFLSGAKYGKWKVHFTIQSFLILQPRFFTASHIHSPRDPCMFDLAKILMVALLPASQP